jgi:hypothetical protein
MAGELVASINGMYFGFDITGGVPAAPSIGVGSNAADFRSLTTPFDFVRVRMGTGVTGASASHYNTNRVNFYGVAESDSTGYGGLTMVGGTATLANVGLVIIPNWEDPTQDLLYAVAAATAAVPANTGVGMRWQTAFSA